MENELTITAEVIYVEKNTDCRNCYCCEEMIYSKMFTLAIKWNDATITENDEWTFCKSCIDIIKSD